MSRKIDLRPLKRFALRLPHGSTLREILLIEDDELDVHTFLARIGMWLKLSHSLREEGITK